jgi:hypothetical protein
MLDTEAAARFGFIYVPEQSDDPLTVRDVLRESFGVFTLAVFLAGVVALVGVVCLGVG